jgi:hypothetical protein
VRLTLLFLLKDVLVQQARLDEMEFDRKTELFRSTCRAWPRERVHML